MEGGAKEGREEGKVEVIKPEEWSLKGVVLVEGEELGNIMVDSKVEDLEVDVESLDFLKVTLVTQGYFHHFLNFF